MSPSGGGGTGSFVRQVEYLISRGHKIRDILYYYTYDQVNAFCEAAYENEREGLNNSCISARVAYHAKNQDFKDFVKIEKKLTKDDIEKEVAKFKGGYKIGKKKVKNANR